MKCIQIIAFSLLIITAGFARSTYNGEFPEVSQSEKETEVLQFELNDLLLEVNNNTGFSAVLKIYSLDGLIVAKSVSSQNTFSLSVNELDKGSYYVSILTKNGVHKGGKIKISSVIHIASE